jgi:hypothetical protein
MTEPRSRSSVSVRPFVAAAALLSILACIAWVDRPVATFAHDQFADTRLFAIAGGVFRPSRIVLALIALFLAGGAAWSLSGRKLPFRGRPLFVAALAGTAALGVALVLKYAIGRSQIYPLYLTSHIHEFRPFRGDPWYAAFPSATIAVASALVAALSLESTRRRFAGGAVLMLLAVCLVITNSHWVADILGGLYLGVLIGRVVALRLHRPRAAAR